MMPQEGYIKVNGEWKKIVNALIKTNSGWQFLDSAYIRNSSGIWGKWFNPLPPPAFSVTSRNTTSITVSITNDSAIKAEYPTATYTITAKNTTTGAAYTVSGTGTTRTVSGIPASAEGVLVTIEGITVVGTTSSRTRTYNTITQPSAPSLTNLSAINYSSYKFEISNYSSNNTYDITTSPTKNYLVETISGIRTVTVSGLTFNTDTGVGESVTATVLVKVADPQNPGQFVTNSSSIAGTTKSIPDPTISSSGVTHNSFTINISNYNANYNYEITIQNVLTQNISSSSYTYSSASSSTSYSVFVKAIDKNEPAFSAKSNTITVTTSAPPDPASGGNSTISGSYTYRRFTSTENLVISGNSLSIEYAIVGGGGGGGGYNRSSYVSSSSSTGQNGGGGGGGGGEVKSGSITLNPGTYTITIGSGGAGSSTTFGQSGTASSIGSLVYADPGGAGGGLAISLGGFSSLNQSGGVGQGGGGGGAGQTNFPSGLQFSGGGGSGTRIGGSGYGHSGTTYLAFSAGGGGAGVSSNGVSASQQTGGSGGSGTNLSFYIESISAGGGGGGGGASTSGSSAGSNGGGKGQTGTSTFSAATSGTANRGGGGGGGTNFNSNPLHGGKNGGSGYVIIRYLTPT